MRRTWLRQKDSDEKLSALPWGAAPRTVSGTPLDGMVRVDTISPVSSDEVDASGICQAAGDWEELEFDGAYTYPGAPGLSRG